MSNVAAAHPEADRLAAFQAGELSPEEATCVSEHLASCDACRELLTSNLPVTLPPAEQVTATFAKELPNLKSADNREQASTFPRSPAPAEWQMPASLTAHPRYRVLELLGVGGMGSVYKAQHRLMERLVALKVINTSLVDDADALRRFHNEIKAAARLSHPNIVTAYDAEQIGDAHFLVMEYVQGKSLAQVLHYRGRLTVAQACECARQAALGLQHAFEQGMVHRDIKPSNLMVDQHGRVKILDFGLARFASESDPNIKLTAVNVVMGTPDYMAPEQADNARQADIRADIYSLGCTLYHFLAGQPPFPRGTAIQKIMAHSQDSPKKVFDYDVPTDLVEVLRRMLAKNPADRYQQPIEVARALAPFVKSAPDIAIKDDKRNPSGERFRDGGGTQFRQSKVTIEMAPLREKWALTRSAEGPTRIGPRALQPAGKFGSIGRLRANPAFVPAAALALLVLLAVSGIVIHHMITDKGELVIRAHDENVEIIVRQGGLQVAIIDPKAKQRIELKSGEYEVELTKGKESLRLSTDRFALTPGREQIVEVVRIPDHDERQPQSPAHPPQTAISEQPGPAQDATANAHDQVATLFVIASDPGVRLTIKQKGATVLDRTAKREIELQPGEYEIELSELSNDLKLSTNRLTLSRGPNFIKVEHIVREAPPR
jgi:predicted Ser/Thr protein kinase